MNQLINEELINSFDRRIPAVLFQDGIDLYTKDSDDIYSEIYYTAAIWNILEFQISEHRIRMAIHLIKTSCCIGVGDGIATDEKPLLTRRVILTENRTGLSVDRLQCNQLEVRSMFEQAPTTQLQWEGDRGSFMQQFV